MKKTSSKSLPEPIIVYFRHLQNTRINKTNLMKIPQLLILSLAIVLSIGASAQKAVKKADLQFENLAYVEAAKLYKVAEPTVKNLDDKARIFFQLGECYRLTTSYGAALEWYDKAITAQYYNINPEVYYNYALCLEKLDRWDDAIAQHNKYIAKGGEKSKANDRIAACKAAAEAKVAKAKLIVENVAELNTPFYDFGLEYSAKKGEQMIFSSARQAANGSGVDPITGESCQDLFFVDIDKKGKMSTPQPVTGESNTPKHEGAMCFSKDFSEMYYTSCNCDIKLPSGCDIMKAKKTGNNWAKGEVVMLVDRNEDDTSSLGQPFLTPDNKFMLFVSDMPGGKGGKDIWYASFDKKSDTWVKPVNMKEVNTPGDDMFPFVSKDGTLYFASNGRGGMGGLDIFKADKTGDISFGAPTALPYPINTTADDFAFILGEGKEEDKSYWGYFTSNRPGGKGMDDIYKFNEPPLEFSLVGTAYDKNTGTPLSGAKVTVTGSDGSSYNLTTDGNGGFSLDKTQIKAATNYSVQVDKEQYIGTGDKFSTVGLTVSTKFAREYFLIPIIVNVAIDMPLVQYPYDQATLLVNNDVNSEDSLNYLLDILQRNPKIRIQLEAHTDARGDAKYNQDLSQRRANTCVEYLIKKGIDPARMVPKGMGENEPKTVVADMHGFKKGDVLTEAYIAKLTAEQQEAAHALNRRTIFKILDYNYVPKK